MKNNIYLLLFAIFIFILIGCSEKEEVESKIRESENATSNKPIETILPEITSLPIGYTQLYKETVDTDNDGQLETALLGYKENNILLLIFDPKPNGEWEKFTLVEIELSEVSSEELREMVLVAKTDWVGWGPPNTEPYQVFVWNDTNYIEENWEMP